MSPSNFLKVSVPNKWDRRFFSLAHLTGSWSEDKSRQVGAVIVGPNQEVRAIGFNGLPRRISGAIESRHSREEGEKYYWFEHAERNAIYNAASSGAATLGCEIYCTLFPCSDCVRAIIQSGLIKLNTYESPDEDSYFQRSFQVSHEMLEEAGIEVRFFKKFGLEAFSYPS